MLPKFQDLKKLTYKTAEVGLRVLLTSNRHGVAETNPLLGSRYACMGTIEKIKPDFSFVRSYKGMCIRVKWDNGKKNVYYYEDLSIVEKPLLPEELFEI